MSWKVFTPGNNRPREAPTMSVNPKGARFNVSAYEAMFPSGTSRTMRIYIDADAGRIGFEPGATGENTYKAGAKAGAPISPVRFALKELGVNIEGRLSYELVATGEKPVAFFVQAVAVPVHKGTEPPIAKPAVEPPKAVEPEAPPSQPRRTRNTVTPFEKEKLRKAFCAVWDSRPPNSGKAIVALMGWPERWVQNRTGGQAIATEEDRQLLQLGVTRYRQKLVEEKKPDEQPAPTGDESSPIVSESCSVDWLVALKAVIWAAAGDDCHRIAKLLNADHYLLDIRPGQVLAILHGNASALDQLTKARGRSAEEFQQLRVRFQSEFQQTSTDGCLTYYGERGRTP